ncbi:MAG TPA: S41 family peptidase [Flavobacteriaceae bacterium]|nr:S41 family peptidase [Flavobacteriaceae bacterium]
MMRRFFLLTSLLTFMFSYSFAQEQTAKWLQDPVISPDGQHLLFGYMGNIYKVNSDGGVAIPLTTGDVHYKHPVWSHDGKTIAFSNDRYGNFDVYTMAVNGGEQTRITYHSADDMAYDFTPDNKNVLVGNRRDAPAESVRFPGLRYFQNLYLIPTEGGRPELLTAAGVDNARFSPDGTQLVFQNIKGYEDYHRKHEKAAITRDIWIYDIENDTYKQITSDKNENRKPLFSNDGNAVFYTSEKNGVLNIYKHSLENQSEVQLTDFENFPVRSLSLAKNGKLAFSWKGEIYTKTENGEPQKLEIKIENNPGYNTIQHKKINSVTGFAVSPDEKQIAFVNRGEVFVTGVDNKQTKRITKTSEQERMLAWAPDSKTLFYSAEIDNSWNIYKTTLKYPEEEFFYAATTLNTEEVIATDAEEFQPKISPDGKKIAYVENRNILKVMDLNSGNKITVLPEGHNFSYSDGDWDFEWSPDSKWLLVDDEKGHFSTSSTALISADGKGEIIHPVNSGFGDYSAKWMLDGKMMTYKTSKLGRKSLAYQGSKEVDIYGVFFDQKAYDEFTLSEDEYKLKKAREEKEEKDKDESEKKKDKKKKDKKKDEPLKLDLENLDNRKVRLTINSASISDYALNEDGSKLYYLAAFEKGYDLWVTEPRTRETKILAKLSTSGSKLYLTKDEESLILSRKGKLVKVDASSGKVTPIAMDAQMEVNPYEEREYIYHHAWRQVREKFYDPEIHGIDWEMYRDEYAKFLPHINNNYDFQILLSELLGELNASHTGGRYSPKFDNEEKTASLGLLYDETYKGEGIKISEVLSGGPIDNAESKVKKGDVITKINGQSIEENENWFQHLTNLDNKNLRLTFQRGKKTFDETIKPISLGKQQQLMYKRWVTTMEKMTDSLSDGQLGYVHVQGMNDRSYREMYDKAMGKNIDKKALVVDTRFNGGGWLHNDLNTFLSGNLYLRFAPQGNITKGGEPVDRWSKPSIVLMSEGNYSDAHIFPYVYKQNGIGKLVGMPVAGTGTAVWWERQIDPTIVFGIPMVATIGEEGRPTENLELEPDIEVPLPYDEFLNGKDRQLEAAVKELLKEVNED